MRPTERIRYYLTRRKIVTRTLINLAAALRGEFRRPAGKKGEKVLIFVRLNARGRIFNLGWVLRHGWNIRTILITRIFEYGFQQQAFDEIKVFFSYEHLVRIIEALGRKYEIVAVVGSLQPAMQTRVLLQMPRKWPVYIDQYDCMWCVSYFGNIKPGLTSETLGLQFSEIEDEKYCFHNADGVIARSGAVVRLLAENRVKTPVLLMEDKCNQLFFQPVTTSSGPKGKEWSVVYPGIFYPMHFDPDLFGDAQLLPLAPLFAAERIHFHLYPSPHHNYQYPEYYAEAKRNPYFHIHPSANFNEIHKEINQYDFGWYANDFTRSALYSEMIRKYEQSLKFYTFLEAGLPIIINDHFDRAVDIIKGTGAGVILPDAPRGLREILDRLDMAQMGRNVDQARKDLEINTAGEQLYSFLCAKANPAGQKTRTRIPARQSRSG